MNNRIKADDYKAKINSWVECAVDDWFRRQALNPYQPMELYYKPAMGLYDGGLYIGYEPLNDGWIATGLQVNGFMDKRKAHYVVREMASTLPILGSQIDG